MKANKNGVKRAFLLLVEISRVKLEYILELIQKHTDEMTFFYLTETCQNTLIVPTIKEVGSVKQPYLLNFSIFQLYWNSFIIKICLKMQITYLLNFHTTRTRKNLQRMLEWYSVIKLLKESVKL